MQYVRKNGSDLIRVLRFDVNRGKGAAIQQGVVHARGHYVLMADADGATRFSDLEALENAMKAIEQRGYGVVVGSRAHLTEQAIAKVKQRRPLPHRCAECDVGPLVAHRAA